MARPKVPEAGKNHPARKVLKDVPAGKIADALGIKVSSIYPLKQSLNVNMADRIAAAFKAQGPKPGSAKPALKADKAPKYAPNNHPAWAIIEQYSAEEIAASCGVTLKTIESTADNGMTSKLADLIAEQFIPPESEEHMKEAMRAVALRDDGEIPQLRGKLENEEAEPEPRPVKSWVDPSVKKGQSLPPSLDLFRQLLAVKGAFLVVPLEGLGGDV